LPEITTRILCILWYPRWSIGTRKQKQWTKIKEREK
jgi:hypothetical protein